MAKKRKIQHKTASPWSDLPDDILELITRNFSFTDLTRFQAVCKNWNSFRRIKPTDQLPWLLSFDDNGYQLHDPHNCLKTTKFNFSLKGLNVCASKKGWLLLRRRPCPTGYDDRNCSSLIAYNPFTRKLVELPLLEFDFKIATFSTTPCDSDCVFFAFNDHPVKGTMIGIWRSDDKNWTTLEFDGFRDMKNVVFLPGSFYVSNLRGRLGVFCIEQQTWRIIEEARPVLERRGNLYGSHLVEFCGRIFLVLLRTIVPCWSSVYELDFSTMEWFGKEALEEKTFFVDSSLSMATAASATKMKNRIYFIDGADCRFYSPSKNSRRCYLSAKPYKYVGDEEGCKTLWIEPPY